MRRRSQKNANRTIKNKSRQRFVHAECVRNRFGSFIGDFIFYPQKRRQIDELSEYGLENTTIHRNLSTLTNLLQSHSSFSVEFSPNARAIALDPSGPRLLSAREPIRGIWNKNEELTRS